MADSPEDFLKDVLTDGASKTASKLIESEISKNLLGPASNELGQLLGDITSAVRFYATDNLGRICKRWSEHRNGKGLHPNEFRRVMPLFPTASLESNEDLQECWARLLEATATEQEGVHPSFGQIGFPLQIKLTDDHDQVHQSTQQ
jgi:hypothetical protein